MRLRLAFLLSLIANQAMAADWWFVPWERDHDALVYIDKSSLEASVQNAQLKAYVWTFYRMDQTFEAHSYRSGKQQLIVDCDKKSIGLIRGAFYSLYGGIVGQTKKDSPQWQGIEAHSIQETMVSFICSAGKQPPRAIPVYDPMKDFDQRFIQRDRERKPG